PPATAAGRSGIHGRIWRRLGQSLCSCDGVNPMGVDVLAAAGSILSDAEPAQPQGGFGFLPLLVIGALFIGFMMWSNRRRQKQAQEFRSRLRPGQRVQLYAGLLGNIVTIGEREVFIELAPASSSLRCRRQFRGSWRIPNWKPTRRSPSPPTAMTMPRMRPTADLA